MRADSWMLRDLPEQLVRDWYELRIETEFDLQVAAYHWIRSHYDREYSARWVVRAQSQLSMPGESLVKPDLVIFKDNIPCYVMELKCQLHGFKSKALDVDLQKLRNLKKEWRIRHAYLFVLYDSEESYWFPPHLKDNWMKRYLSLILANVRRHPNTDRMRKRYPRARELWTQKTGLFRK